MFTTAFTSVRHQSLFWVRSNQFMPLHPTSWRSIFILSFHLHLGLPSRLFPSGFPTKTPSSPLYVLRSPSISFPSFLKATTCLIEITSYSSPFTVIWGSSTFEKTLHVIITAKLVIRKVFRRWSSDASHRTPQSWGQNTCFLFCRSRFDNRKLTVYL